MVIKEEPTFQEELEALINKHCLERHSNTPDFILAEFMAKCLHAFNTAVHDREKFTTTISGDVKVDISETVAKLIDP